MDMVGIALIIATITAIPCAYSVYVQKRASDFDIFNAHDAEYGIHWLVTLLIIAENAIIKPPRNLLLNTRRTKFSRNIHFPKRCRYIVSFD